MSQLFSIPTALYLPAPEIEALIQGLTIAAMPRMFIRPGQRFALCPADSLQSLLPFEKYYNANVLPIAKLDNKSSIIKAWAKCELCQILDATKSLDILSKLTIFSLEALKETIEQQQHIFLAYLRVYNLDKHQQLTINANVQDKTGRFVALPTSIRVTEESPLLSDRIFAQRKNQLEKLELPQHIELQELQSALAAIAINNPAAKKLDDDIKVFLGWTSIQKIESPNPDLAWIKDIAALGDRSIELDEKKSNYQAGTDFENIARQSLEFLGFKVESAYKGGAGGLDLYCSQPYSLVCECKAGKLIPSRTVEELLKLGGMHLGKTQVLSSAKLVIGPGNPSSDTIKSAKEWEVSIINAMTLQKLVELKAKYPGAINLVELQKYLAPGQIDYKIEEYIDKTEKQIHLRSQIIAAVKELSDQDNENSTNTHHNFTVTEIRVHYNAIRNPKLTDELVHDLLIELSSPLTGYLGREKGTDWKSDRFYFLRDLQVH
ncbi:DUF1802 family protein [Anabaena azotica]|uniref:DUF1802 family protein n=1 Tax=Anabaena azotica FACHB-119 TaxID=947527 RepID=A0ABR8DBH7_9NOST|nr:DUF1802 family protein [Anabaena azotica]MBD2504542.1 DUF1802 family protein [Anabaena azotica FACHB-119]